jgi:uncharacterized membrane protein YbhN (UPF0104 family)
MTARRILLMVISFAVAMALMVLLFVVQRISIGDLVALLRTTPAWLLFVVLVITVLNQMISVIRWRTLSQWLNPNMPVIGWSRAFKATSWGSFLGQFLPLQLAVTLARWTAVRTGTTVGATLYEGLFDFVILLSGAGAGLLLLVFGLDPKLAFAVFCAAILAGCASIRWLFRLGGGAAARLAKSALPGAQFYARLIDPLDHASRAPASLLSFMVGWSVLRIAILSARIVLVASVFAGAMNWAIVAIGYPVVGIALAVPFVPAGLGVADWSLTGVLLLAGVAAPLAAATAAAIRLLNIFGLGVLIVALVPVRTKDGSRREIAGSLTLQD